MKSVDRKSSASIDVCRSLKFCILFELKQKIGHPTSTNNCSVYNNVTLTEHALISSPERFSRQVIIDIALLDHQ